MKPVVSVIIPAYNAGVYLKETLESALAQTYTSLEIIVVDDGSTDDTASLVKSFGERVKLVSQKNAGCSAARNTGIRNATGDLVAFLDSDDLWAPEKLSTQVSVFKPHEGFNYTNRSNFGILGALSEHQSDGVKHHNGMIFERLLEEGNFVTTSSVLMERSWCLELGTFRESLKVAEDWDLWLRSCERKPVSFCQQSLVRYRIHTGNISRTSILNMFDAQNWIVDAMLEKHGASFAVEKLRRNAKLRSAEVSAFAAANAGNWTLAIKLYSKALRIRPTKLANIKGLIKCLLRRA